MRSAIWLPTAMSFPGTHIWLPLLSDTNNNLSLSMQSKVPPGFRFHPTEEELLQYYLRKKVLYEQIDLDVIQDVDLNKLEPWDIQEKCKIGSTPQNDWYFFSHKDKKYPTGTRTNRATTVGFWKATGRDKVIYSNSRRIGMRKTLVFYKGRAPHGQKSDWIMHEYRLDDNTSTDTNIVSHAMVETTQEEGWVVCRIFKKKNHYKTLDSPINSSSFVPETRGQRHSSSNEGTLEQILQYVGRTCKDETEANDSYLQERFMNLPSLESPNSTSSHACYHPIQVQMPIENEVIANNPNLDYHSETSLGNWAALDRLVASHLNGQNDASKQLVGFNNDPMTVFCSPNDHDPQLQQLRSSSSSSSNYKVYHQDCNGEFDLWSHMSNAPV
ncbi:hypothetical protein RJ639_036823 [Escallonia herrerae]|uniref:NAC domain-containing protein n=1 Tax=Escallonia herrerae TaxID=1293975 RepID=A0AA88WP70_9ASTE|nr:hypothetical protein RJ639_036823 [Escallonia herrerae]